MNHNNNDYDPNLDRELQEIFDIIDSYLPEETPKLKTFRSLPQLDELRSVEEDPSNG